VIELFLYQENYPMKRTFFGSKAMLLILTLSLAACGGGASMAAEPSPAQVGDPAAGEKIFASACVGCHGRQGKGVPGLSQDMSQSELVASTTDQELFEFIKTGRAPGDASLTPSVVMPPKGGNPSLTDQNLANIVAYVRSLQR
jgi:disulfide bond formation protein DsbB